MSQMFPPTVLLVNPYLYDFAAYDLWIKPLGLLYVGAVLAENGCDLVLLDCMDRWHPDVLQLQKLSRPKSKPGGDGDFYREAIAKPSLLADIPRNYYRFGLPPALVAKNFETISRERKIDLILVTSGMSYWYRGVHELIDLCHQYFPKIPVWLGGIYATLYPQHARSLSGADLVFTGESEIKALRLAQELLPLKPRQEYNGYDDYPLPAYHLYPQLEYAAMMTSRGCPFCCPFCATRQFTPTFHSRTPAKVVAEIEHYSVVRGIRNIAFYDDALFVNAEHHIKPILRQVVARKLPTAFHTPNGLFAKLVDAELAELMVQSGFTTVRLSYESKDVLLQQRMGKVNDADLAHALQNLERAGFPRYNVMVYLMMGLPNQTPEAVAASIEYVASLGARVSLSSYSPIPGTPDWELAVTQFGLPADEPLLTNKTIYPLRNDQFQRQDFDRLKLLALQHGRRLKLQSL